MEVIRGAWSTHLDPMCYDPDTDRRNARVVVDACKPFNRRDSFPIVARSSAELDERIKLDDRISSLEARLIRQFSALDALVAYQRATAELLE